MPKPSVSKHAKKRMKERNNISSTKEQLYDFSNALKYGYKVNDYYGPFRRYLERKRKNYYFVHKMKVYQNKIYVYSENLTLITILKIPYKYQPVNKCTYKELQLNKRKAII